MTMFRDWKCHDFYIYDLPPIDGKEYREVDSCCPAGLFPFKFLSKHTTSQSIDLPMYTAADLSGLSAQYLSLEGASPLL